jgi:hypothetical protein
MDLDAHRRHTLDQLFATMMAALRAEVADAILRHTGGVVQSGPFRGMKLSPEASWGDGDLPPKLLGVYEAELHETIAASAGRRYGAVVNVGCAEGYYAVGLGRLFPDVPVIAFDPHPAAQRITRAVAEENGIGARLDMRGTCTAAEFAALAARHGRLLCVIDCEGGEASLLPEETTASLTGSDLIIECHDFLHPGITETLAGRFAASHSVSVLASGSRNPNVFPFLASWDDTRRWLAVNELRPCVMNFVIALAGNGPHR